MTTAHSTSSSSNTRWWESYLVRYFVGFIVGMICVLVVGLELKVLDPHFNAIQSSDSAGTLKPDWSVLFIVVSLVGLGYCYVASTPITVLHTGRFSHWWLEANSRHFWLGWIALLIGTSITGTDLLGKSPCFELLMLAFCSLGIALCPVSKDINGLALWMTKEGGSSGGKSGQDSKSALSKFFAIDERRTELQSRPVLLITYQSILWGGLLWSLAGRIMGISGAILEQKTVVWWLLSAPVFWIGLVQYSVLFRILAKGSELEQFYVKLSIARSQPYARDMRDTYTHLREHSNSVFIVVVELAVLAFLIALAQSTTSQMGSPSLMSYLQMLMVCLAVWMIPTVFMWARANRLEKYFAENHALFGNEEKPKG